MADQNEDELRALEVEAAKVMGWTVRGLFSYRLYNPEGECVGEASQEYIVWRDYCPEFARDPAAILVALEWLTCDTAESNTPPDPRYPVDEVSMMYTPTRSTVWLNGLPVDAEHRRFEGKTLGIAICRAIVALKEKG